jgi:hypothetical protein
MSYVDVESPPITITTEDMRYLSVLGLSSAPSAEFLAREVDRANIVPVHQALPGLVRMGSLVKYHNNTTGKVRDRVRDGEERKAFAYDPACSGLNGCRDDGPTDKDGEGRGSAFRQYTVALAVGKTTEITDEALCCYPRNKPPQRGVERSAPHHHV